MTAREFDVVVWGASGFTGELVAEYLANTYGVGGDLRWAIAGRNPDKLEQVRETHLPAAKRKQLPVIIADSNDPASLAAMVARTAVICTTVGPYAKYGTPLVAACAEAGTACCDLAGEVQWQAKVISSYQGTARATGARIVQPCGFDSIPFDLGVWFLQQQMLERHGVYARQVKGRVGRNRGGPSGGTIASMINLMEEAAHDPAVRRIVANPYALYPEGEAPGPAAPDQRGPVFDPDFGRWTAPFVMALVNTRVVRRTNALLEFPWGRDFRYDETMLMRSRLQATRNALGLGAFMGALALGPTRKLAQRFLPAPGEGPSRAQREAGFYELYFHGIHPTDRSKDLRVKVSGDMDPGYGSTAKMLGETAVSLAHDEPLVGGGFWTPAAALNRHLLHRLTENAGLGFELVDTGAP